MAKKPMAMPMKKTTAMPMSKSMPAMKNGGKKM